MIRNTQVGVEAAGIVQGNRVGGVDAGSLADELAGDIQGRGIAQVVGVLLEGESEQGDRFSFRIFNSRSRVSTTQVRCS